MDEKTKSLLLQIAGFLTLINKGLIPAPDHAKQEAGDLLNGIEGLMFPPN